MQTVEDRDRMKLNWVCVISCFFSSASLLLFRYVTLLLMASATSAYEEPEYEVLQQTDDYEIRVYTSYLVAETRVSGDFDQTGNTAFQRLAGYIFGNNKRTTSDNKKSQESVSMKMTVPVTRERINDEDDRTTLYRFVMERSYDRESLPIPNDDLVTIAEVKGGSFAALRYRGRISEARFKKYAKSLESSLRRDGIEFNGEPISAVYNGPFTPPFLRRNEVLLRVSVDEND